MEGGMIHTLTVLLKITNKIDNDFKSEHRQSIVDVDKVFASYFNGVSYHIFQNGNYNWLKITFDLVKMLGKLEVTEDDLDVVCKVLTKISELLNVDEKELRLNRIDYRIDVIVTDADERNTLVELFKQNLSYYNRRNKDASHKNLVDYKNKSIQFRVYDKVAARSNQNQKTEDYEEGVLRLECAVCNNRLEYAKYQYEVPKEVEAYFTKDMMKFFMLMAIPMHISLGDFYTLKGATKIIDDSHLSKCNKEHLKKFISYVAKHGMDAARKQRGTSKGKYNDKTFKDYVNNLESLRVNPITIPVRLSKIINKDYIKNPFYEDFMQLINSIPADNSTE